MTERPTEAPRVNIPAAYDLLRLALGTLGTHGVIDYMVDHGVVFSARKTEGTPWTLSANRDDQ